MRRALLTLLVALALPGLASAASPQLVRQGRDLYVRGCVSCHGPDARGVAPGGPRGAGGVTGAGPSLVGAGALAADFELRTGYMPLRDPRQAPRRSKPTYAEDEIDALVAYVGSLGGPGIPLPHPRRGSLSEGLRLFTESCAGCHQVAGRGGVVTGSVAPPLSRATPVQVAEAVRLGPYVMPRFPRSQLSDRQLDSIILYLERAKHPVDRGGWGIGHIGPVPEGLVAWLLAGSALVLVARVIGGSR